MAPQIFEISSVVFDVTIFVPNKLYVCPRVAQRIENKMKFGMCVSMATDAILSSSHTHTHDHSWHFSRLIGVYFYSLSFSVCRMQLLLELVPFIYMHTVD